ncbi:MAG: ParB/RepB/Spo0J family partition protein [Spirochaetia bacterium]|nr:ParB/RepB/Spo0J family partition protein [Spirochaetia bacterium]
MSGKAKKVLGRGLGNLLENNPVTREEKEKLGIIEIKTEIIRVNPNNPRKKFDESAIEELGKTIKEYGLLQPILVRKKGEAVYVISGERRLRACRLIGLKTVPCIIKEDLSEEKNLQISLIENIQREQLDPIEEASVYKDLIEKYNFTQEILSEKVGKNRSTIANKIRLLKLPLELQTAIADGKVTEGQIRPILSITDKNIQNQAALKIIKDNLNARQVEEFVKKYKNQSDKLKKVKDKNNAELENIEKKLEEKFLTRVNIAYNDKKKSGVINIHYFNLEDFERITTLWGIE